MGLLVAMGCAADHPSREERTPSGTLHRSGGISVIVPAGWTAQDTRWADRFSDGFLIVRNAAARRVPPPDPMISMHRGLAEALRTQLPPGGAVVLFSRVSGGIPRPNASFLQYQADTVGESLAASVDCLGAQWRQHDDLSTYGARCEKWDHSWNFWAFVRGVPSVADRCAIEDLFASITFPDLPIVFRQQALRLAYARLPPEARFSGLPAVPGYNGNAESPCREPEGTQVKVQGDLFDVSFGVGAALRRTVTMRRDSTFVVTFQVGADSSLAAHRWSYSVSPRGEVEQLEPR
jgi:hypothetical protein